MEEPNWEEHEDTKHNAIARDDLVWVRKKTRGRFPDTIEKAKKGDHGIVVSAWHSSAGSHKLVILTSDQREIGTTASCARVFGSLSAKNEYRSQWDHVKVTWMDSTYVPIIVTKIPGYKADTWAISKNKSSILVKPLNGQDRIWLSHDKVHPHDWAGLLANDEACAAVRVPVWLAKKGGVFGDV
jgi:hypothetical protein